MVVEDRNRDCDFLFFVNELLKALKSSGIKIGLVTGNARSTGSFLLRKSGLEKYFDVQCYSDDVESRAELVSNAIFALNEISRKTVSPSQIIVVGDTVHDITSAHANGCISLGVCTGFASKLDFENANTHHILDNLKNTSDFLSLL